jgi:hypothetical protein
MEIRDSWVPLLLQAVRDGVRYKESLLRSETLKDVEEHEENLVHLDELLAYLTEEYKKNQHRFRLTPEEILGEKKV